MMTDTKSEITFPLNEYSDMAPHKPYEGGALNASYTFVDAACKIAADYTRKGLVYGRDFRFDDRGHIEWDRGLIDGVKFKFEEEGLM